MSYVINNVSTAAEYPENNPQSGGVLPRIRGAAPCAIAEIDVTVHPVYVKFGVSRTGDIGQASPSPELLLPIGHRTILRKYLFGITFRDAVAGEHGIITCELIPVEEVWLDFLVQGGGVYK